MPAPIDNFTLLELSSCKVWLKNSIRWEDQKKINAPLYAGTTIKLNPITNQPESVEAKADVYEKMQEQEVLVLLHRIEDENGQTIPISIQALEKLDMEDYNAVVVKSKEIYDEIKKKSKATQTLAVTQSN